jgi:hypothetical protein
MSLLRWSRGTLRNLTPVRGVGAWCRTWHGLLEYANRGAHRNGGTFVGVVAAIEFADEIGT